MPHYYHVRIVSIENEFKALMFHPQYAFGKFLTTTTVKFQDFGFYVSLNFTHFLSGHGQMLIQTLFILLPQLYAFPKLRFVFRVLMMEIYLILENSMKD
jgi:hypothetical protein